MGYFIHGWWIIFRLNDDTVFHCVGRVFDTYSTPMEIILNYYFYIGKEE